MQTQPAQLQGHDILQCKEEGTGTPADSALPAGAATCAGEVTSTGVALWRLALECPPPLRGRQPTTNSFPSALSGPSPGAFYRASPSAPRGRGRLAQSGHVTKPDQRRPSRRGGTENSAFAGCIPSLPLVEATSHHMSWEATDSRPSAERSRAEVQRGFPRP